MNKARRNELNNIIEELNAISERLGCIFDEEDEMYEAIPENLKSSDRGIAAETACANLSDAADYLDDVISLIEEAIEAYRRQKMKNILKKWNITKDELNKAVDELRAKGVAKGCYQNINALYAALELLTSGNIKGEDEE